LKHLKIEQAKVAVPHICDERNVPLQPWLPGHSTSHCIYGDNTKVTGPNEGDLKEACEHDELS
jgi:hypothetical protein